MTTKKVREKIRVNINISPKLKSYFEELSEEMGCTQSALMCLALNDYMDGKTALKLFEMVDDKERRCK